MLSGTNKQMLSILRCFAAIVGGGANMACFLASDKAER